MLTRAANRLLGRDGTHCFVSMLALQQHLTLNLR